MYFIALSIFILQLQTSDSQYPDHMDFQKVGEAIFNNEKYKILKPTTHVISDYFKEFMLRRDNENSNFPTKRVFIDHNGFRHHWAGFGEQIQSLRKTDLVENIEKATEVSVNKPDGNENVTDTVGNATDSQEHSNNTNEHTEGNDAKNDDTSDKLDEKVREPNLRGGSKNGTKTSESSKKADKKDDKKKDNKKKDTKPQRTVATTTFFCPFFGVITMSAFID